MHKTSRQRGRAAVIAVSLLCGFAGPAVAQNDDAVRPPALPGEPVQADAGAERPAQGPAPTSPAPSAWRDLFGDTVRDIKRLPSRGTLDWLAIGSAAAIATHAADGSVSRSLSSAASLHEPLEPGAVIGSTPFQMGASVALYAFGRWTDHPRLTAAGADLVRAQLIGEALKTGLKQAVRRQRPEGGGYAFPSGHTTVSFASATVLQRHFGWRIGVPAYGVASYVALSRVQMRRHYLSDVAFGAALGIVVGRTVTVGGTRLELSPAVAPGGGGVQFTWLGRK